MPNLVMCLACAKEEPLFLACLWLFNAFPPVHHTHGMMRSWSGVYGRHQRGIDDRPLPRSLSSPAGSSAFLGQGSLADALDPQQLASKLYTIHGLLGLLGLSLGTAKWPDTAQAPEFPALTTPYIILGRPSKSGTAVRSQAGTLGCSRATLNATIQRYRERYLRQEDPHIPHATQPQFINVCRGG
jgi:hypothetical protein